MTDKNRIRVGSRDSALSVVQSKMAIAAMQNVCPETGFELITMKTTGRYLTVHSMRLAAGDCL